MFAKHLDPQMRCAVCIRCNTLLPVSTRYFKFQQQLLLVPFLSQNQPHEDGPDGSCQGPAISLSSLQEQQVFKKRTAGRIAAWSGKPSRLLATSVFKTLWSGGYVRNLPLQGILVHAFSASAWWARGL